MQQGNLRARQRRFVDEYLVDCNATRAAIAAGYSKSTASQAGYEVLRSPKVAAEISRRQKLLAVRHQVSADNLVSELAKMAFANLADFYRMDDKGRIEVDTAALADPAKAAAISQIEITENAAGDQTIKIKLADKRAALCDVGRHLGLFSDRSEIAVTVKSETHEPEVRDLALAALALLNEASYQAQTEPLLIEDGKEGSDGGGTEGFFDIEA